MPSKASGFEFLDVLHEHDVIPTIKGNVFAKVLRLVWYAQAGGMLVSFLRELMRELALLLLDASSGSSPDPQAIPDDEIDEDLRHIADKKVQWSIMHRRRKEAAKKEAAQDEYHRREAAAKAAEDAKAKAKDVYEARVKAWRYDASGGDKGVRLLLSTLHSVLWEGAKWTPVSMGQLMSKGKVRLWYLKAVRVVHPDHHQSDASDRKYLCQQIFDGLSHSFKRFEQEEMGKG